jgi:peptidoglycan/LPS O-acetylase OafA/YrhL
MYTILLLLHSWLRWLVLGSGLWAIFRAYNGMTSGRAYDKTDKTAGTVFISSLHSQLLIGIVLAFFSPFVNGNMAVSMKDPSLRFWTVEHWFIMLIGIAVAQIGSIKAKKIADDTTRHRTLLIWFGIGFAIILFGVFYTVSSQGRPWMRM